MLNDEENGASQPIIQQNLQFFNPASYNLPHFKYKHLPASEVRNAWTNWIRWFESVMAAANVWDGHTRKMQLLAMGGLELQGVYFGLPGIDDPDDPQADPYEVAKDKLSQHFAPKHHDSFERFLFWSLAPEEGESIDKFALRVRQRAEKICFGKTETESRHIAVIDKIIQYTSDDLRQKLLEKETLTLDDTTKIVNAYQSVRYQSARMTNKGIENHVNRLTTDARANTRNNQSVRGPRCNRCGFKLHLEGELCPAAGKTCLRCGKVNHFRSVCHTELPVPSSSVSNFNFTLLWVIVD